jgi:dipeptidyl aminopeptidase/acylaminoacyl peptidase
MRLITLLCTSLLAVAGSGIAQTPSLEQIMADPDWIGPPVEDAWLSLDGAHAFYRVKKAGSPLRDLRRVDLATGEDTVVPDEALDGIDASQPVFDRQRNRALFVRNGDLFLRDLRSGALRQLSRGETISAPRFGTDGKVVARSGERWLSIDPASGLATPLADLRFENDPLALDDDDALKATQLRLFETLARERAERQAQRDEDLRQRTVDESRGAAPWYLGDKVQAVTTDASPDGRWLLLATQPAGSKPGTTGKMPKYVTESGYTEIEDVRTRVGRDLPVGQSFELLDLRERRRVPIALDALPGIKDDPLAELRSREGAPEAPPVRAVVLLGARWSDDGRRLALQLRSVDNKDRWLVGVEPSRGEGAFEVLHRLTDPAWINWSFNDFGWLPDGETLWYLSEESGHSHLYTRRAGAGTATALTRGTFEVHEPALVPAGDAFVFMANVGDPTAFDLFRIGLRGGGEPQRLTSIKGVERFSLSTDGRQALLLHSGPYVPAQLAALDMDTRQLRRLTDTRTPQYRAIEWPQLRIVPVPSSHGDRPVWSKLYTPARMEPGKRYPAVLFVHGAGYTQNTHQRFPYYFREQMFHQLLVERGFIVLDMDYRASAGYGRDWRTVIYRQMGHPELEDLIDGIDWLVAEHQVDPARIGVYGGSYGGFMALMAMFREPERFAAGAALRPVTDWRHYNHGYTANILNTPDLDPEAHRVSSPIEYAEGLRGPLLIAHGMLDDNVFYQDSVMLAQRLIELEKEDWELAGYPLERHGYVHPESWLDQYRRILKLFEGALLPR